MYGPVLSVLLMGMIPVWGAQPAASILPASIGVAAPAETEHLQALQEAAKTLTASGIVVVDMDSGQTIFEAGSSTSRPMASLTKLMTALIIAENHQLDEQVRVPSGIDKVDGTVARLKAGDVYTVGDMLSITLIMSANDAAVALATHHSGSVPDFVDEMNARARSLGLKDTLYENPTGLDAPKQVSSPRDIAWLAMYVLRHPDIAQRMGTKAAVITSRAGTQISLSHTHDLLHSSSDVIAGKTGTTDEAGQCLFSVVIHKNRRYGIVLLHSADRYADMRKALKAFEV